MSDNEMMQGAARFRRRAVKVDEALRLVLEAVAPGRRETLPLWEAGGRRLAEAVSATTDWPPFARAGLDGYAVRSADTALASPGEPATLRVLDAVAAGALASVDVSPGTAVRIMTGGAVPPGADAVVMLEQTADARLFGQPAVRVKRAAEPGQNIAPRGEEFRRGSVFAGPGDLLRPGHVALLGTFGYADVPVYARPRIAVLATGAELLPVDAPLEPGRIRDSNSAMVAALVAQCGGVPILCGRVPDEPSAAAQAIAQALSSCDAVITTGGVSVGDYDVMAYLLQQLEGEHGDGQRSATAVHSAPAGSSPPAVPAPAPPAASAELPPARAATHMPGPTAQQAPPAVPAPAPPAAPAELPPARAATHMPGPTAQHAPPAIPAPAPPAIPAPAPSAVPTPAPSAASAELPPGSRLLFNKTAMRPGAPTSAAVVSGKLLIALSGNPGACFVGFQLFARAAIHRLQGVSPEQARPKQVTARLIGSFDKGSPHERFVRTRLYTEDGTLYADPLAFGKSSMLASIPAADGLVRMPVGPRGPADGEVVDVILL